MKKLALLLATALVLAPACARKNDLGAGTGMSFRLETTAAEAVVDGRLREPFWKTAERMGGFRVEADPARLPVAATEVRLAFSDGALLVAFECAVSDGAAAPEAGAAGDEFCEISLFSRPETPFYSPYLQRLDYMNAADAVRTMRRFQISPSGERREANVYKVGAHSPYIVDESWDGEWKSAVVRGRKKWTAEIALPWAQIGGKPLPGHTFRLNFIRRAAGKDAAASETSCFNWASSPNLKVDSFASENFIQEYPTIFATAVIQPDGSADLHRFVETEDPWAVKRDRPEFETVLTDRPDPRRSAHFYIGITSFALPEKILKALDAKARAEGEARFLEDIGGAGMNGPFLPAFLKQAGEAGVLDYFRKYGAGFSFHGYADARKAREAGASILTPPGTAAFIDPVYIGMKNGLLRDFLGRYGRAPWLIDVWGQDEPFNQIATLLQPGTYERVEKDIKAAWGEKFGLGVPIGLPDTPYQNQPVHENSRRLPDPQTILNRIAAFRWLNKTVIDVARGERAIVDRLAPGKLYQPFNRNSVADLDFLDQAALWEYADVFSADPYPSFCIYVYGPARARYHVGFTAKMVTDLAAGKPTQMILQGCTMIQRRVTSENVREWASQAAKAGVSMIDWYGTPKLDDPDLYREILRVSKLWKNLPALDLPANADVAVLFGDDARAAAGDEGLYPHYSLHAILGETLGAWFTFVGENQVRRGIQSLDGKSLIIAPELSHLSKAFAEKIRQRVEDGAALVVLDPDAFTADIETGSLEDLRGMILGSPLWEGRPAESILPTEAAKSRWNVDGALPLRPIRVVAETRNARIVRPPEGATILYTYEDGSPAAYVRKLGKGEVIVFGAMPFQDSELAVAPGGWEKLLARLLKEKDVALDLPVWRFLVR